jgi:predicted metal-dependent phosphotriesterase family hydrolase
MSFLRTVLGDVPADTAGITYAHEHIIISAGFVTFMNPDFLLDSVERACVDVKEFACLGGRTLIDSMPCSAGRNVRKLVAVASGARVNIVCPTGVHLSKYYAPGHWSERFSAKEIAKLFVADIEEGIDWHDYDGPFIERSPHRAGLIKVATGLYGIDDQQKKIMEAAAAAHHVTGAPLLTHTEEGTAVLDQIELLRSLGVPLEHVCISHTDRLPDITYHREILSSGVCVEYDSAFRWKQNEAARNPTLDLVLQMFADGFGDQVMLGMDAARRRYWHGYDGQPGLAFLIRDFVPRLLAEGMAQADIDRIFIGNPARCYAFTDVSKKEAAQKESLR